MLVLSSEWDGEESVVGIVHGRQDIEREDPGEESDVDSVGGDQLQRKVLCSREETRCQSDEVSAESDKVLGTGHACDGEETSGSRRDKGIEASKDRTRQQRWRRMNGFWLFGREKSGLEGLGVVALGREVVGAMFGLVFRREQSFCFFSCKLLFRGRDTFFLRWQGKGVGLFGWVHCLETNTRGTDDEGRSSASSTDFRTSGLGLSAVREGAEFLYCWR